MKNEEIIEKLNDIPNQLFSIEDLKIQLQNIKEELVKQNNQDEAKQIWIYQTIIEVHILYRKAFNLLKNKMYYEGWCELERAEIELSFLKKHFQYDRKQFYLFKIEKAIRNLQVIFPYKIFSSSEILIKKEKCSVCNHEISIRKPCIHIVNEIYNGEMCYRTITEFELLGISLVQNPENKYAVAFMTDPKTNQQVDYYNYEAVDFLFNRIENPYEQWNLVVNQKIINKESYGNVGRNDNCPCGSGKKFKKCCSKNIGKKYPHFEFIVAAPESETKFIANTLKNNNTFCAVNKQL